MHKSLDEMTLKDLMDKLEEIRVEHQGPSSPARGQAQPAGILSINQLAEFLATSDEEFKVQGIRGEQILYFRELDLPA